jgi:hypothetical protein
LAKITLRDILSAYSAIAPLNHNFDEIEEALENTLSRDGTAPNQMLADLDMNHRKIRNLALATASSDAITYGQAFDLFSTLPGSADLLPLYGDGGAALVGTASGENVQTELDRRAPIVADATEQADYPVTEGQGIIVSDHAGGEFIVRSLLDVLAESTARIRILPFRPAYLYITVDPLWTSSSPNPVNPGDTITLDGHTATFVAAGPVGAQILIGSDRWDTAKNIRDYINANIAGWEADGGYAIRVRSLVPGPSDNGVTVAESTGGARLKWSSNGNNASTTTMVGGSPAENNTITLGDHAIALVSSGASGQQINMGADASTLATNLSNYINANTAALGLSSFIDDGLEVVLVPETLAGLIRLQTMTKVLPTATFSYSGASADPLGAIYRPSTASPDMVHVRRLRNGALTPQMWGMDDGDTSCDIPLQAMFNYQHDHATSTFIDWCGLRLWVDRPIVVRNNYVVGHGGWLINESAEKLFIGLPSETYDEGRNSCIFLGIGHPGHDEDIVTFSVTGVTEGGNTFTMASGAEHFKVGDVIAIRSTAGHQQLVNLFQFNQRVMREIVDKSGTVFTVSEPFPETISNAVAGHFAGLIDTTTGKEIVIAKDPTFTGLNFKSPYGGCMARSQPYRMNLNMPIVRALRGLFPNASNGKCEIEFLYFQLKAWEVAHSGEQTTLVIHNLIYERGDALTEGELLPIGKWGECSQKCRVIVHNADLSAWRKNTPVFYVDSQRGCGLTLTRMKIGDLKTDLLQMASGSVGLHDTQPVNHDFSVKFGHVTYGGTPSRIIGITNDSGEVRRVHIMEGIIEGSPPTGNGTYTVANSSTISAPVRITGNLRFDGNGGSYRGRHAAGYSASSTGINADLRITSEGENNFRKRTQSTVATSNLLASKQLYDTITGVAGSLIVGDAVEQVIQFTGSGTAGTKHISLTMNGVILGTIDIPAATTSGTIRFRVTMRNDTSVYFSGSLDGAAVSTSGLKTGLSSISAGVSLTNHAYVANAADTVLPNSIHTRPDKIGHAYNG